MKNIFIIIISIILNTNSFAIDLSDYSKEEREQYKKIKKMKKDGVSGKDWIDKKYWIKDKKNFYNNIASFHTGIEGLKIKKKQMPILGIKVGGNWNWKSGKKKTKSSCLFCNWR